LSRRLDTEDLLRPHWTILLLVVTTPMQWLQVRFECDSWETNRVESKSSRTVVTAALKKRHEATHIEQRAVMALGSISLPVSLFAERIEPRAVKFGTGTPAWLRLWIHKVKGQGHRARVAARGGFWVPVRCWFSWCACRFKELKRWSCDRRGFAAGGRQANRRRHYVVDCLLLLLLLPPRYQHRCSSVSRRAAAAVVIFTSSLRRRVTSSYAAGRAPPAAAAGPGRLCAERERLLTPV